MLRDSDAHRVLLGDGPHPAPQRGRDHQGDRQPRARAGQHRQAGRRAVPGARALQRAGRPHDGHLGAAAASTSSTRSQAEFGFDPPREHGLDTVDSIRAMRDGKAHVFIGLGGNFVAGRAGHRRHRRGAAPDPADGADLDQAQPLAPGLRRDRADPADPGPHREGHPGQRPAVGLGGGLDLLGARLARPAGAGEPAPAVRGRDRHRIAEATLGDRYGIDWQAMRDDYRRIRGTSPGWSRAARATR